MSSVLIYSSSEKWQKKINRVITGSRLFSTVTHVQTLQQTETALRERHIDIICAMFMQRGLEAFRWFNRIDTLIPEFSIPVVTFTDGSESSETIYNLDLGAYNSTDLNLSESELQIRLKHALRVKERCDRLRLQHQDLSGQVLTDALTGLPNRRSFDRQLKAEGARNQRNGTPFSLMMLDMDHFKQLNDKYGHQAGDKALRAAAVIFKESMRTTDMLARYGGEEFAAILPNTRASQVGDLSDRIHKAMAQQDWGTICSCPQVTVSIGISDTHSPVADPGLILAEADKALYRAKELGRNRTEIYCAA